jgi:hypothetical protein
MCAGTEVTRLCALVDPSSAAYNPAYSVLLQNPPAPLADHGPNDLLDFGFGLSEAIALLRRMKACPDRLPAADCSCAGLARCMRERGHEATVSHRDCFACLRANDQVSVESPDGANARLGDLQDGENRHEV